ncbi:MAG TPA: hypothetical protein VGY66_14540 [Gemmataceae bacterium]|nr:hypothetical protein [Gemmataceae bacterium]
MAQASSEADWRTAAGRAYYTLMLEAREALRRWGFSIPKGDQIHRFVRLRLLYAADSDLRDVSLTLEESGKLRAEADYQIENPGRFATPDDVRQAIIDSNNALVLLDRVNGDNVRLAAAISAIQKAFP